MDGWMVCEIDEHVYIAGVPPLGPSPWAYFKYRQQVPLAIELDPPYSFVLLE
jgi:hypothetical protein